MSEQVDNGRGSIVLIIAVVAVLAFAGGLAWMGMQQRGDQSSSTGAGLELITNSIGMQFVKLPEGSFTMGEDVPGRGPAREVRVGSIYMATHEVTQQQWMAVMGNNPSQHKDPRRPVDQVTWLMVQSFLEELNRIEGTNQYRLPTEAEWEYAARAGTQTRYFFGDSPSGIRRFAWVDLNNGTRPVGMKQPNPWGLFDVYGNVWEWVQECWHEDYSDAPATSRLRGGGDCTHRVLRGGGWNSTGEYAGSTVRGSYPVNGEDMNNGFRVVLAR